MLWNRCSRLPAKPRRKWLLKTRWSMRNRLAPSCSSSALTPDSFCSSYSSHVWLMHRVVIRNGRGNACLPARPPTSMFCCLLTYCMAAVCEFVRRSHFLLHYSGWFTPEHYFEWVSGEGGGEGGGGDRVCPDAHPAVSLASSSVFCLFAKYFFWWMISRLICALQQAARKQGFRPLDMIDGGNTDSAVRI